MVIFCSKNFFFKFIFSAFSENEQPEVIQRPSKQQQQSTVLKGIACGRNHWCLSERNEVFVNFYFIVFIRGYFLSLRLLKFVFILFEPAQ